MATAANTYKPNALMIRMLSMDDDIQPDIEEDVVVVAQPEDENVEPERGNWTGRFDFLLSLLGYSVGLGNVWRFPYLCYNNGGGAFLIPFTVMLIVAGLPLMFMELSFGQFAALGPVAVYNKFCPLFRGLGYGMVIVSCIVMMYYNLIIAWTLHYLGVSIASIFSQLPWQNCDADWSTRDCYSYEEADRCEAQNGTYYLRECFNQTYAAAHNISVFAAVALRRPPAEEYFTNKVLGLSSGIEETGHIRWEMALCLLAAWIIVFLCLCKGVHSSGKVVYFTALFPYVVLVILFVRGVTLPGAGTGILFYLTPDFSRLATAQVWGDAAVQIFFALSPAWGGLITLSSYNKFTNNCYRDALIVAVSNIGTSFFAGLVIFSVLGFLAHELRVNVDQVVDQGPGLAFIVYPEVVTRLPVSPLWSILFFLMLLTLGLDSQFTLMETVTTAILDKFPNMRQNKVWVVLTVAVAGYLGGLIFTTNSGMYWLQLIDKYAASWSVLIIAIGECILIAWIYGTKNFCRDIQRMIGKKSKRWEYFWSAMWRFITPAALVFILVFNWIEYKPAQYGHYVYPTWADAVGWTLAVLPVVVVVIMAIDIIYSGPHDLTIMEKARVLSRPTNEWGPPNKAGPGVIARRTEPEPPVLMLHGRPVLRERGARPPHTHPLIAMRKVSLDSGDNTSITSGTENETKKSGHGIKSTKNSIKRKMLNLNIEHDNTSDEPLLHITKDKSEINKQSAKLLLSKTKTDASAKDDEKDKLLEDNTIAKPSITDLTGIRDVLIDNGLNDLERDFSQSTSAEFHHMNRNELNGADGLKQTGTVNTQILVEVDTSKPAGYNQTQLIFTTAKIHADGIKPKHVTVKKIEDKLTEQKHTYSKLSGTIPRSSKEVNTITYSVRSLKEIKSDDSQPFIKLAENTVKSINTAKATVKSSENNTSRVNSLTTSIRSKNKFIPDKKVSTISKGKESTPLVKPVELKTAVLNPTAGDVGLKYPQVATVASSITKGKITTSNTSLPLISSLTKKDTSPLTVKTTSLVPTAKSSIITTVPPAKKTKGVSTSVNKPTSTLANTTSPVSRNKSLSAKSTSTVTVAPNANSSETTTKSFTDNVILGN